MKETKLKVGIYLRLSDEDKIKSSYLEFSESIKNQRYLLLEEIKRRDNFLLVDEYIDENLSGAGTYRPEFERLIKDCELGKIDVVLCKSQSRFSRDMEIIEKYLHNKFIEWNIRFISLSDNADTIEPGNKKSRQINGLVNEWYLEDVSNNIRSAFRAKMLNGEYISPFACFGYKIDNKDNNKLVVDLYASEIVKKIFDLYISGMGYLGIAKHLNNQKIPSPSYYKYLKGIKLNIVSNKPRNEILWNENAIKKILTNEIYIGNLIQGKRTTISYKNHKIKNKNKNEWIKVWNTHEAIIDKEIFFKVQDIMNKRTKVSRKNSTNHIFSGKVHCSNCGSIMKKKNSNKHEYLVCTNSQIGLCTNKKAIRYDVLEKEVLDYFNKFILKYFDLELLKNKFNSNNYINTKLKDIKKEKMNILDRINKINFYYKKLYEDKINDVIDLEQYIKLVNSYKMDEDSYREMLKTIELELNSVKKKEKNISWNVLSKYRQFDKLNIVIIEEFISDIVISEIINNTRYIDIKWNLDF